ncbi:MAG: lipase class 2 [Nocardioides sp.]|nr:lipase class 2 [Nocardioides sp.]
MLDSLSPARRRFVLLLAALAALVLVAVVAVVVTRGRDAAVTPVSQAVEGPVLLVPGYGGDTTALDVLAQGLRDAGRETVVVRPPGSGTGNLRDQAAALGRAAEQAMADSGAGSVDVVGYSAGGVVVRLWVADDGGGDVARRVVTLASPHHGTDLASLAGDLAPDACPEACQQLATDSDLLRRLNAGDESPPGPIWVALWTTDDQTVVPPDSGELDGAVSFSLQSVCPGVTAAHGDVPRTPSVIAITIFELGTAEPRLPGRDVCAAAAVSP